MKGILKDVPAQLWNICTQTRRFDGELSKDNNYISLETDSFIITEKIIVDENGVYLRTDTLKSKATDSLNFSALRSRFMFDGGEYEVYTQYNGWQNESQGCWQPLTTEIRAHSDSVRTAMGAVPFLALWNCQTNRGYAFHLLENGSWSISAKRYFDYGENSYVGVELGIDAPNVNISVNSGEEHTLPQILFYEFSNKLDMDSWKLHRYCHKNMRERKLPVIYNTWLYRFAQINFENVMRQIPAVARLGTEYFVIDAGWFGKNPGWEDIGDWEENLNCGFKGRMIEIAEEVRKHSMKFGLWFEPERAVEVSDAFKENSKYFIGEGYHRFLNFADKNARNYIFDRLSKMIKRYGIEFVKFDFNSDITFDNTGAAFTDYFKGYRKFIQRLHDEFPNLYISNCASGGMRMTLPNCYDFESFWFSDNQSPYYGMRIFKDSILRLPPQVIERWSVIASNNDMVPSYTEETSEHIFATADGIWRSLSDVSESYLKGFLSCGPIAFSCDIASLSENVQNMLQEHVAEFKEERTYWSTVECRILADTESLTVLQFNDSKFKKCVIQIFTKKIKQTGMMVYPFVDKNAEYSYNEKKLCGQDISENGIYLKLSGNYQMKKIELIKE